MEKSFLSFGDFGVPGKKTFGPKGRTLFLLVLFMLTLLPVDLLASMQQRMIRGKVTGQSGETLPGVTILFKGTTIGTITDTDGRFNLAVPSGAETLMVSFVGMKTQEIAIGGQSEFTYCLDRGIPRESMKWSLSATEFRKRRVW